MPTHYDSTLGTSSGMIFGGCAVVDVRTQPIIVTESDGEVFRIATETKTGNPSISIVIPQFTADEIPGLQKRLESRVWLVVSMLLGHHADDDGYVPFSSKDVHPLFPSNVDCAQALRCLEAAGAIEIR